MSTTPSLPGVNIRTGAIRWLRLRVLLRMPLQLTCAIFLCLLVVVAIGVAPLFEQAANNQDLALRFAQPFTLENGWLYILGGDALGRSEMAQVVFGARTSFLIAFAAVLLSAVLGTILGMACGYVGGAFDALVMRVADVIVSLPTLLIAVAVLFVLEPSPVNLVVVIGISRLPIYMRTARAQTLTLKERVFVEASRSLGATRRRIVFADITPLVTPTILTIAMLEIAGVMLAASGLSFLGVGLERPNVDWGTLVSDGRGYLTNAWWMTVFPGLAIALTSLSANLLANWLRAIEDPNQSGRLIAKLRGRKAR